MRLFVGVTLDAAMIAAAVDVARELQRRLGDELRPRWVSAANMHLTVRFIGHVPDERAPAVLDAMRAVLPLPPFDVALGACGVFPLHGAARVLWIGLAAGLPPLRAMHEEINRRLAPLGYEPEPRDVTAHLPLARIKDAGRGASRSLREAVREVEPRSARCRVAAATVFRSRLSPNGPTYEALFEIPCSD